MAKIDELKHILEEETASEETASEETGEYSLKKEVMTETGKAVEALYHLDIALSKLYVGDKGTADTALATLRNEHIRKALDSLNTGDLLDLVDAIENTEGNEDE